MSGSYRLMSDTFFYPDGPHKGKEFKRGKTYPKDEIPEQDLYKFTREGEPDSVASFSPDVPSAPEISEPAATVSDRPKKAGRVKSKGGID